MKRTPPGPVTELPHIDPSVAAGNSPIAQKYLRESMNRAKLRQESEESLPIPNLSQSYSPGMTMADQARAQRHTPAPPAPGSIVQPNTPFTQAASPGVLQGDLLPQAATQDPQFQQGMGSMYAVNQPLLAYRYGVIRNGQYVPGQQVSGNEARKGAQLREDTVQGLKEVMEFTENRKRAESSAQDKTIRQESEQGLGGAASRAAQPPLQTPMKPIQDEFDLDQFRENLLKDLLNNDEQRKMVEERCTPLSLADLLVNGEVTQTVPIRPGEYEPEFVSYDAEIDLKMKEIIAKEMKLNDMPDRYYLDKYSVMAIVVGTVGINGRRYPSYRDEHGNFSEEAFWEKYKRLIRLPFHVISSLGLHYRWFDERVRRLVQVSNLKNG